MRNWLHRASIALVAVTMAMLVVGFAMMPAVAQTNRSATYFWGEPHKFEAGPTTPYKPVDPKRELPAREWDPRSDATREVMRHLNATVCPTARTFTDCWTEAPPRPGNPNVKRGFIEVAAILYEGDNSIVNRLTRGKLPAEYGRELWEASADVASGVFRANCTHAYFRFSNMEVPMPTGPYPLVNWHNQYRESVFIDTVARAESRPGYGLPQNMAQVHRGQVRFALPEIIFTERAKNPIGRVDAFHNGVAIRNDYLPSGASGLYTIPWNPQKGKENDWYRAARETGMLRLAVIVPKGTCPRFDFANFKTGKPQRR